jgi:predicted GNAT family N-acyltransferase
MGKEKKKVILVFNPRSNAKKNSLDEAALHFVAYADKQQEDGTVAPKVPVGTLRLIKKPNNVAKLGRLAVLSEARGLYIGQNLVKTYIAFVKENGYTSIVLHSQYPRRGFYEKLGFVIEEGDEIFDEDGTPHIRMWMRQL